MKYRLYQIVLIFVFFIVQTVFVPFIRVSGNGPELLLLLPGTDMLDYRIAEEILELPVGKRESPVRLGLYEFFETEILNKAAAVLNRRDGEILLIRIVFLEKVAVRQRVVRCCPDIYYAVILPWPVKIHEDVEYFLPGLYRKPGAELQERVAVAEVIDSLCHLKHQKFSQYEVAEEAEER